MNEQIDIESSEEYCINEGGSKRRNFGFFNPNKKITTDDIIKEEIEQEQRRSHRTSTKNKNVSSKYSKNVKNIDETTSTSSERSFVVPCKSIESKNMMRRCGQTIKFTYYTPAQ